MKIFILSVLIIANLVSSAQQTPSLIPFRKGTKWGYSDSTKKIIIAANYKMAFPFVNGKAIVETDKRNVLQIASSGKTLLVLPYKAAYYIREYGYIKAESKDYRRGLIKPDGTPILPAIFEEVEVLGADSFEIRRAGKKGIINGNQKVLKPFVAYDMNDLDDLFSIPNDLCPKPCLYAPYYEGRAVTAHKGRFGYADEERNLVIPCKYTMAGSFYYGCASVLYEAPGQTRKEEVIDGVRPVSDRKREDTSTATMCRVMDAMAMKMQLLVVYVL